MANQKAHPLLLSREYPLIEQIEKLQAERTQALETLALLTAEVTHLRKRLAYAERKLTEAEQEGRRQRLILRRVTGVLCDEGVIPHPE